MPHPTILCHIVAPNDWRNRPDPSRYAPASLADEGFIHLATLAQVTATANRYYAGRDDLLLLLVDVQRLNFPVRWEDLYGHGTFPHLYGPLISEVVVSVIPFPCDAAGMFALPESVKVAYADACC